eukprot:5609467-Pyramimonas_sp.AAC.1
MRTSNRTKINPACYPRIDDGSERCMVAQCNVVDTAALADQGAHARQTVRNSLRERPALTFESERGYLENALRSDNVRRPKFKHDDQRDDQRQVSEWLTTALRREPFHRGHVSDMFSREVTTHGEYDGWAELSQLLNRWPAEGHERHHPMHVDTVRHMLKDQH